MWKGNRNGGEGSAGGCQCDGVNIMESSAKTSILYSKKKL